MEPDLPWWKGTSHHTIKLLVLSVAFFLVSCDNLTYLILVYQFFL